MSEQGFDCEKVNIAPSYTEQKSTPVDWATGETSATVFINNELEGEKNKTERLHSLDNTSDDYPLKEGQPKTSLTTNISRPKKLKTDGDDPTQRTRNCSKPRTKILRKQLTSLPPPPTLTNSTSIQYKYRMLTLNINGIESHNSIRMLEEFLHRHDLDIVLLQ